jgi:hypothetical protein
MLGRSDKGVALKYGWVLADLKAIKDLPPSSITLDWDKRLLFSAVIDSKSMDENLGITDGISMYLCIQDDRKVRP